MGLLDDAIREHLELKRLHGADASEVARQEHEALGPVRREDIAMPDAEPVAPAPELAADPTALAVEPEEPRQSDPLPSPVQPATGAAAPDPAVPASVTPEPADPQPVQPDVEPVASTPGVPEPVVPGEDPGQATVAFSLQDLHAAEAAAPPPDAPVAPDTASAPTPAPEIAGPQSAPADVVPADAEPEEHDELEETPEFLQETPEHDRLWFEQKPPRDFDF